MAERPPLAENRHRRSGGRRQAPGQVSAFDILRVRPPGVEPFRAIAVEVIPRPGGYLLIDYVPDEATYVGGANCVLIHRGEVKPGGMVEVIGRLYLSPNRSTGQLAMFRTYEHASERAPHGGVAILLEPMGLRTSKGAAGP